MLPPITRFYGEYRWLSNFWVCEIDFDGRIYSSVEHAFQSMKTTDPTIRANIAKAISPYHAKKAGHAVDLRPYWEDIRVRVMGDILMVKFGPSNDHPKDYRRAGPYHKQLMETAGRNLVEGNNWSDTFWGQSPIGRGTNWLGKLLMAIRDEGSPASVVKDYEDFVHMIENIKEIKTRG